MELKLDSAKIEHLKGLSVINLTKYIMERFSLSHEEAYKKLFVSETYSILMKDETEMFLETDVYLREAFDIEQAKGKEALYAYLCKD